MVVAAKVGETILLRGADPAPFEELTAKITFTVAGSSKNFSVSRAG